MNFVESINFNNDKDLIYITDEEGIKIYDTNNYQLLIKLDPERIGLKGELSKFQMFYSSKIFVFSFIETIFEAKISKIIYNNAIIKKHSIIFYDVNDYSIIGRISMKNMIEINNFLVTKFFIILMIENKNKAILFKTSDLTYFNSLKNVYSGKIAYNDDYIERKKNQEKMKNGNRCILAYIDYSKDNIVILNEYIWSDDYTKVLGFKITALAIYFNSIRIKQLELVSNYLIVVSNLGNKIHIYDIKTNDFKYCLYLGNFFYEVSGLNMDNKKEIISVITNNKYLKLYKLNQLDVVCKCNNHDDEKVSLKENRTIFENFVHNLKIGRNDIFCRYKINFNNKDIKDNKTLIYFDDNDDESLYLIEMNKTVIKLKFDRNKDNIQVTEVITLPKYAMIKDELKYCKTIDI